MFRADFQELTQENPDSGKVRTLFRGFNDPTGWPAFADSGVEPGPEEGAGGDRDDAEQGPAAAAATEAEQAPMTFEAMD